MIVDYLNKQAAPDKATTDRAVQVLAYGDHNTVTGRDNPAARQRQLVDGDAQARRAHHHRHPHRGRVHVARLESVELIATPG